MSRVGLAISAYRSDDSVERLLREAVPLVPSTFDRILVVDSLGSGRIPELIARESWQSVQYVNSPVNLGSAGNLAERLERLVFDGCDFIYAVNHDGSVDAETVKRLLRFAEDRPRLGAAYPLRRYSGRGGKFDLTGTSMFPRPFFGSLRRPLEDSLRVYWSSSNGALYCAKPVREGLLPWRDFWMGWEDLAYGWLLEDHGYEQYVVSDAEVESGPWGSASRASRIGILTILLETYC
jgi:GT2 family glycosyltransferase